MNIIGIFGPKIVALLGIWIPSYDLSSKLVLTAICGCKLMWDYDRCRPGHSGLSYRLASNLVIEAQEIVICVIGLCISVAFGVAAFRYSAWIPVLLGLLSIAFAVYETAVNIKDAVPIKSKKQSYSEFRVPQMKESQPSVPPIPAGSPVPPIPLVPPVPFMLPEDKLQVVKPPRTIIPAAKLKRSFEQEKNKYYQKRFSILGDSISTLEGFNPVGYNVFYTGENCAKTSVYKFEDTWWGQIIDFFGGELLVNNSWSGSQVSLLPDSTAENMFPSGCSKERTGGLHKGELYPDVIIVNIGINDWANGVYVDDPFDDRPLCEDPTEDLRCFGSAYSHMLHCIHNNYPDAEIWCCTLGTTYMSSNRNFVFPHRFSKGNLFRARDIENYNYLIKQTASNYCKVIDLYDCKVPYDTIDGTHPNAEGMKTIADVIVNCLADDNPEIHTTLLSSSDLEGTLIGGKYRLLKCISKGGISSVYLAANTQKNEILAVKVVESYGPLADLSDGLEETFVLQRSLSHPAIPKAEAIIGAGDLTCFVSEYLQGQTLDVVLKDQKTIEVATLIDWALQLCDVLEYLHSQDKPICLRGLCPSNILLQPDGKLRLVNIEAAVLSNLTNFVGGADLLQPGFAAPERFVGNDDIRADIFSLGMVLHYLATGVDTTQPPYNAGPVREYRPDLPQWFEMIVEKCIEIDPQKRFQNCDEVELCLSNQYAPCEDTCYNKLLKATKFNGSRMTLGRGNWYA